MLLKGVSLTMQKNSSASDFFLSANTPQGFFSVFNHLYYPEKGWFCHILKGGPGTGKSTLMKKIAKKATEDGVYTEVIHCSSDPDSLDAVIFPELKKCVADGTAPHVLDPIYPGATDAIVNLGECWDTKSLYKSRNKIINLCKENSSLHDKSKRFLRSYGNVANENRLIISESIDYDKLNSYCKRLTKKLFKQKSEKEGFEQLRFISSVTPEGYMLFDKTMSNIAKDIFIIEDPHDVIGNFILNVVKEKALSTGHDIIACPAPLSPGKIEALFVPSLELGLVVKNIKRTPGIFTSLECEYKKIGTKRFLNTGTLSKNKNLLNFNYKICGEFLNESINNLKYAKAVHDDIEVIYKKSMNYSKINKITDKLISAIF
jgi:hypothetical protein